MTPTEQMDALPDNPFCAPPYPQTEEETLTGAQIKALLAEAAEAGDTKQVEICNQALLGYASAWRECARVIAAAEARAAEG